MLFHMLRARPGLSAHTHSVRLVTHSSFGSPAKCAVNLHKRNPCGAGVDKHGRELEQQSVASPAQAHITVRSPRIACGISELQTGSAALRCIVKPSHAIRLSAVS